MWKGSFASPWTKVKRESRCFIFLYGFFLLLLHCKLLCCCRGRRHRCRWCMLKWFNSLQWLWLLLLLNGRTHCVLVSTLPFVYCPLINKLHSIRFANTLVLPRSHDATTNTRACNEYIHAQHRTQIPSRSVPSKSHQTHLIEASRTNT